MDTKNNIEIRKSIDRAIEKGNMREIQGIMSNIPDCEPKMPVNDFIKSVKEKCVIKEDNNMKSKFSMKALIAVAAVAVIGCVSVGAATVFKTFTFNENGRFVSVTANNDISEEEAARLANKEVENIENVIPNEGNTPEYDEFNSIKEAEKTYDMTVILPDKKPELDLSEVKGLETYFSENSSTATIWTTYGNPDEKAYGLTVTKKNFADEDITDILSTDAEVTGDKFVSNKGYEFDILNEIDEATGKSVKIFVTYIGNYEYAINFVNFDDDEIENVVNSIDLGEYKN